MTFWASAASSLVCSVNVSNCLRECSVDNSMKSAGGLGEVEGGLGIGLSEFDKLGVVVLRIFNSRRIAVLDQTGGLWLGQMAAIRDCKQWLTRKLIIALFLQNSENQRNPGVLRLSEF